MDDIITSVAAYYAAKLARHGAVPRGVDWSCRPSQELRFVQLLRICEPGRQASLDDLGCGYGALVAYLDRIPALTPLDYLGIDLSPDMIGAARSMHPSRRFVVGRTSPRVADYAVASGIMNVRLDHARAPWEAFVASILTGLREGTRRGFAVNFMARSGAGDVDRQLYRSEPERWSSFCATELGCEVEVLAGYGLREFTLLARHADPRRSALPEAERAAGATPSVTFGLPSG